MNPETITFKTTHNLIYSLRSSTRLRFQADCAIIPPDPDSLTDEENIDDEIVNANDDSERLLNDLCGTIEVFANEADDSDDETPRKKTKSKSQADVPASNWKFGQDIEQTFFSENKQKENLEKIEEQLGNFSPFQMFQYFFDQNVSDLIIEQSIKYSRENNDHDFTLDILDLYRFIGVLLLSGYHSLPQVKNYWCKDADKQVDIVRESMSRAKFEAIKKYLYER